jgi:hypothetical protein
LRTAAKLTQARYGINIFPAKGETRPKEVIVARIAIQRTMISIRAKKGLWGKKIKMTSRSLILIAQ